MRYIAHRGKWDKEVLPNSREAIENGLKDPLYIGIECDIRETLDHEFIIYHDILYKGNLVKYTKYSSLKNISKLEDILKINTSKIILLEIKEIKSKKKFIKLLNKYNRNIYIMSFNKDIIYELRSITNKYKYGILNYVLNTKITYDLDFICLLDIVKNKDIVNKYTNENIEVFIYGVVNPSFNYTYIIDDIKLKKS